MTNINNNGGLVQISDDVLVTIAQTATMEVEGVSSITSSLAGDIIGKFGKKIPSKGINIINEDGKLIVNTILAIKMGYKIIDVANEVQNKITNAIEMMTGLEVYKVNIDVVSVDLVKEIKKEEENN